MTSTKRKPKPMTGKQIAQYQELRGSLIVQAELIMSIFKPLGDTEHVTDVKFDIGHPQIDIWYQLSHWDEDYYEFFSCPENYLSMTEDELKAEKTRLEEEEKRKKAERAAKAKATREKHKAEKEAAKKVKENDERYKKYLELKAEFEGAEKKPVKEAVYLCKYWEHDDDDPSGCGESWQWCHSEKSGRRECGCVRTYAMQFCPFYKKGKLAGKWVIDDEDKEAAEKFKKEFEARN
jgi:hypothetical protein